MTGIKVKINEAIFTRGQFWASGKVIVYVCVAVCALIHEIFCTITCHPFRLESPNLEHKNILFKFSIALGWWNLTFTGQIYHISNL